MHPLKKLAERVLNDEPETPFDAEPANLNDLDVDDYDQPDIGDEDSK